MSLDIGQVVDDKYRIVRLIGEGGMGSVFEGENFRIRRRVAIKVLLKNDPGNNEAIQRFEREAQAAGQIGNDHILEVLDIGRLATGEHYIVMEYLDGVTLTQRLEARGQMSPAEITPIIQQVMVGLGAAHAAGIIHRDLKPDNIFILKEKAGRPDFVKLIDFGISKFVNAPTDALRLTRDGTLMGTPYYMSPEQCRGNSPTDVRSDIFSLGVIIFEAVTGRTPFEASTFNDLMFKIALEDAPRLSTLIPDIDPAFEAIVAKALARDPSTRFQTVPELVAAFQEWSPQRLSFPEIAIPMVTLQGIGGDRPAVQAKSGSGLPHANTLQWSQTQHGDEAPARSKKLILGGTLAAVVTLVLGVTLWSRRGPDDAHAQKPTGIVAATAVAATATVAATAEPPPKVDDPLPAPSPSATPSAAPPPTTTMARIAYPPARDGGVASPIRPGPNPHPKTTPSSSSKAHDFGY